MTPARSSALRLLCSSAVQFEKFIHPLYKEGRHPYDAMLLRLIDDGRGMLTDESVMPAPIRLNNDPDFPNLSDMLTVVGKDAIAAEP